MAATASNSLHFVIFPFMAQGHTIPLLHLARLLSHRHLSVTVVTTAANSPSIQTFLNDPTISIVELSFPENIDGIPPGIENSVKLPSFSMFLNFVKGTELLRPQFERVLEEMKPAASCIVSDAFFGWTQDVASNIGIPRIGFTGMSSFASTMYTMIGQLRPHPLTASLDEPFQVPNFPTLFLTKNDFHTPFHDLQDPFTEFIEDQNKALGKSYGLILNSVYELEAPYTDFWNSHLGPKAWSVGPLCLSKQPRQCIEGVSVSNQINRPDWRLWLDQKIEAEVPVLYIAFGTHVMLSPEQLFEIAEGLEKSNVNFLWVIKQESLEILQGFDEKLKGRGRVVGEWVDQMDILHHKCIEGFLTPCGWNSLTESICAKVPILALPFVADQHLNARLAVEEMGVGIRIRRSNGSVRGFVKAEEIEKQVRELMEGLKGEEVRRKMEKVGDAACIAMQEGGSSWSGLDQFIYDVSNYQPI